MSKGEIEEKNEIKKDKEACEEGLDMKDGVLWYCDANKGWICNLT